MRWFSLAVASLLALSPVSHGAIAQSAPVEVDVELFLAVDVSRSMSPNELEIQRRGYAEALASDAVWAAIDSGLLGRVAITYVEWAGVYAQRTIIDWTLIDSREAVSAFSQELVNRFDPALRRTSISGALMFAAESFENNGFEGLRQVIDVSGDGPNNDGRPVLRARNAALEKGIIINGLPLMTKEGLGAVWNLEDLDEYYRHCVIGGPGSFVIPVTDWDQFADAVRRKLILELVDRTPAEPRVIPAQFVSGGYDCLIGEKIWERNRRYWELP